MAGWTFVGFLVFVISDQYLKRYRLAHPSPSDGDNKSKPEFHPLDDDTDETQSDKVLEDGKAKKKGTSLLDDEDEEAENKNVKQKKIDEKAEDEEDKATSSGLISLNIHNASFYDDSSSSEL